MIQQSNNLLEIKNLSTVFQTEEGKITAVKSISFNIKKGKTIGIVGESGSGKSVTSLSIMQLLPNKIGKIENGEILLYNNHSAIDLAKLSETEMQNIRGNEIAMIFQEPMTSLNPVMRCGDQIIELLKKHKNLSSKEARLKTLELFESVQLPRVEELVKSYPHELSGGQKQRVMIAMAMACEPQLLIADEPTTALDVTIQKSILQLMQTLQQQNKMSILFITHDLGVIAELADEVLVMYKGEIVEQGDVVSIFKNPQHPYTKSLLACRPSLTHKLSALPTIKDFMNSDGTYNNNISVEDVVHKWNITDIEIEKNLKSIYAQEPLLSVKNLDVSFITKTNFFGKKTDSLKAVNQVSFDVYPGETVGLVGESGCGKTTLGRAIMRLKESDNGKIYYKGNDIKLFDKKALKTLRKDIQIIFQDPYSSLNPSMTIGEALLEPMHVHDLYASDKIRKERISYLLQRVSMLPEHYHRYPHEFSGGQRQRISIARALAVEPSFIVCDESVSALDVSVQAQVLNLLNELKREFKLSYLFISHDLSVVKFMSDNMLVMQNGFVVERGNPQALYQNPKEIYTQNLIKAIPKGDLASIEQALMLRNMEKFI